MPEIKKTKRCNPCAPCFAAARAVKRLLGFVKQRLKDLMSLLFVANDVVAELSDTTSGKDDKPPLQASRAGWRRVGAFWLSSERR